MSVGCEGGDVEYKLKVDSTQVTRQMLKFQAVLYGVLGIMRRLGLPKRIDRAIALIQRMIASLNMLRVALATTQAAMGPTGWAMAGIAMVGATLTVGDLVMEAGS